MDSFSAHGDQGEMQDFLDNQLDSAKQLFLVHGEIKSQEIFKTKLLEQGFKDVVIQKLGEEFEL